MPAEPTISTSPYAGQVHPALGADRAKGELQYGSVYPGVIRIADPLRASFEVVTDAPSFSVPNCVWAGGIFSALLGIRTNYTPPPGSRVLLVYGNPAFIIASAPSESPDTSGGKSRTLTHEEVPTVDSKATEMYSNHSGSNVGADFLTGEFEIGTNFGVAIQFLTTLVKLQAGDRAKVECHLTDELVRIVSGVYRHFSAFGDLEIADFGGGPTVIQHGTSKTHEAWGRLDPGEQKADVSRSRVSPTSVAETGRWRCTSMLGYLGDMVHFLVTEPEKAIGQFAQSRVGKFDAHINNDGSFIMRTVGEVSIEKVIRMAVPVELKRGDAADGNTREEIAEAVRQGGLNLDQLLKRWDYHPDRIHYLPYVLRHYARYLSQLHAYARILSQDKDFSLSSEANAEAPSWNNREDDVARANGGSPEAYEVYCCMRILRDGSIMNIDGNGNSWLMTKRGVQASSVLDFEIEAARDVRITCGRNLLVNARRNIELNAITGAILTRARTLWRMLCEWGGIHIKSDQPDPKDPDFSTKKATSEDKVNSEIDPDPVFLDNPITIDAERGSIGLSAGRRLMLCSDGSHLHESEQTDLHNDKGSIVLSSKMQDVRVHAFRNMTIEAVDSSQEDTGMIHLKAFNDATVTGMRNVLFRAYELFDVNNAVTLRDNILHARGVVSDTVAGVTGVYGPLIGPQPIPGGTNKSKPHINHIRLIDDAPITETELATPEETGSITEAKFGGPGYVLFPTETPSWEYLPKDEYYPDAGTGDESLPWRSHTQERLADEADDANYATWSWASNRLNSKGARTGRKYPFPWYGEDPQMRVVINTEPLLSALSGTAPSELGTVPEVSTAAKSFRFKK